MPRVPFLKNCNTRYQSLQETRLPKAMYDIDETTEVFNEEHI